MQHISQVEVKKPIQTASRTTSYMRSNTGAHPVADFMRQRLGFGGKAALKTLDSYDPSWQPKPEHRRSCQKAHEVAKAFLEEGRSLVFFGPNGVGKTHLALGIGNALLERYGSANAPALFIGFGDALAQLRKTYQGSYEGQGESFYLERWVTIPVLILDEIGQRGLEQEPSEFTRRIGYALIDGRYRRGLPIVITTNKNPNDLCAWITESAVDRLWEMGRFVKMEGKSWRQSGHR